MEEDIILKMVFGGQEKTDEDLGMVCGERHETEEDLEVVCGRGPGRLCRGRHEKGDHQGTDHVPLQKQTGTCKPSNPGRKTKHEAKR